MHSITKTFEFHAAHRVLGHQGKCRFLHGHSYKVEVTITSTQLNKLGMVLDFSEVKKIIGDWIDQNWDHNIILHVKDPLLLTKGHFSPELGGCLGKAIFGDREPFILQSGNPTAELMAMELYQQTNPFLVQNYYDTTITKIVLWETSTSCATFIPPGAPE